MEQRPAIAVLTSNILVGVGLRSILEKAAPAADVELFGNFQEFAEADPERFIHYFVTAQLFAAHNAFFRARSHRTIVLANGQTPAGVHCIDVQTDEEEFVHALVQMQRSVRRPEHTLPELPQAGQPLSEREAEVLALIGSGAQARSHLLAIREIRKLREVRVWSPSLESDTRFAREMGELTGLPVRICASAKEAAEGADILCTLTKSEAKRS